MTIQVTISGHATGKSPEREKAAEAEFLAALAGVVVKFGEDNEVYTATASAQHHGSVDLLDHDWTRADDTEPRQEIPGVSGTMRGADSHGTA